MSPADGREVVDVDGPRLVERVHVHRTLPSLPRGFTRSRVLLREAMPNAGIATVNLAGVQLTFLIGGTVLVERIFSYEGIGNMAVDAMINRDLPLIQGLVLTFAVIFIALNLLIDLLNAWLDPRLQHG